MKKATLKAAERYRVAKLLEEHLTEKDAEGLVTYRDPSMNDKKIAQMIGPHVSVASVSNMRVNVFGPLRKHRNISPLEARVDKLEESFNRISALEKLFDRLSMDVSSLIALAFKGDQQ